MNDGFKIILGALFAIILIGCVVMIFAQPHNDVVDANNTTIVDAVQDKVNEVQDSSVGATDDGQSQDQNQNQNTNYNNYSNQTNYQSNSQYQGQSNGSQNQYSSNGVTGGQVENNYQEGQGSYYQINYKDGNFRQYDTKTGELIGSTFDEDQAKLGSGSGDLE